MMIIKLPNNIITCNVCKATIQFDTDDILDMRSLCTGKSYKAIICPCCNKVLNVYNT